LRIFTLFIFFSSLIFADTKILELFIGGDSIGTYMISDENGSLISDETVEFGSCISNNISSFTKSYEIIDDEKLYITPKKKCLETKELRFSQDDTHYFKKSSSIYLNYALARQNNLYSATLGSGLFSYDTLLYLQGRLQQQGTNSLENYFALKEFDEKKIKLGKIYATSGSFLTKGYTLNGVSFYQNTALVRNAKSFDYQLVINNRSTIEIYNNDKIVQKLTLDAGIYNLKELPITHFSNNIKIVMTDSFGNKKEIEVPFLYSSKILKEGFEDYSFSFGVNEQNTYQMAGYYRRGISKDFTAGFSFDSSNIALLLDYLTPLGKVGLHIDKKADTVLEYSYSKKNFYLSATNTYKEQENDFRLESGFNFERWGNLSLKYHQNGEKIYGADYSVTAAKNLNFTLNSSFNTTTDEYRVGAKLVWNFGYARKRFNLIASNTTYNDKDIKYLSASMPIIGDEGVGFESSYEEQKDNWGYKTNRSRLSLQAKYKNDFWINTQKINDETATDYGVSGAVGCVFSQSINCGIGQNVYAESGFILNEHVLKYTPPYYNTTAHNKFNSTPITLKSGQGYWLDPSLYKSITGIITLNGKPYKENLFMLDGKEYFTGFDGEFWVDSFLGEMDQFAPKLKGATCSTQIMNIDEELYEVQINCMENEDE